MSVHAKRALEIVFCKHCFNGAGSSCGAFRVITIMALLLCTFRMKYSLCKIRKKYTDGGEFLSIVIAFI